VNVPGRMPAQHADERDSALRLAIQIATELLLYFVPVFAATIALVVLNLLFREQVRTMGGTARWLLLLAVVGLSMAITAYGIARAASRILPPGVYTLWSSAVFGLLIFLIVFLRSLSVNILFLYAIGLSLLSGAGFFVAVGLPTLLGKLKTDRGDDRLRPHGGQNGGTSVRR